MVCRPTGVVEGIVKALTNAPSALVRTAPSTTGSECRVAVTSPAGDQPLLAISTDPPADTVSAVLPSR
jgi:hypothetical protein